MNNDNQPPVSEPQTIAQMREVIMSIKSGDKFKVVFLNKTFNGEIRGMLGMILGMYRRSIDFDDLSMFTLKAIAESGKWEGFRTYIITALDEFDPGYFISRTIGRRMLESVNRVEK